MNNSDDLEKIYIRSEKVRSIMSEEPPIFIRYGTMFIAIFLLIIFLVVYTQ